MSAVLTDHGEKRVRKRMGLGKKVAPNVANKALELGITHSEVTGSLKKYLDKLYLSHHNANNIRIYNRNIFLFHNDILVTVIDLPSNHFHTVDKLKTKRQKQH